MLTLGSSLTAKIFFYSFIIQSTWSEESEEPANFCVIWTETEDGELYIAERVTWTGQTKDTGDLVFFSFFDCFASPSNLQMSIDNKLPDASSSNWATATVMFWWTDTVAVEALP